MNYLIVQLTAEEAVFALFARKAGGLVFKEASRHNLQEKPLAELLPEIAASRTSEAKIILAIPPSLLFMREVSFPISDRRKVREILPMELKGETAVDIEELVFEALHLEGARFLAVWGKRAELAVYIRLLAEHGLEPEMVTASFFHWSFLLPGEDREKTVALTDSASLALFRDAKPLYFRSLGTDDFLIEVNRTLAALEIGKDICVDTLLLHGGAARAAHELTAENVSTLPLPFAGELADTFSDPAVAADLAGVYAVARACAKGELVDFRRGDLAYTAGNAKTRRKLLLTAALAIALVVLLFGELGLRYYLVQRDVNSINSSIHGIYRQVFPERKKAVDAVAEIRTEIKRLSGVSQDAAVLPVLKAVAELKGEGIIGIYETEVEGGQIRLKGDASSVQAANDFKARSAGAFSGAELGEIKSRPDGTVSFVFRAAIKGGTK